MASAALPLLGPHGTAQPVEIGPRHTVLEYAVNLFRPPQRYLVYAVHLRSVGARKETAEMTHEIGILRFAGDEPGEPVCAVQVVASEDERARRLLSHLVTGVLHGHLHIKDEMSDEDAAGWTRACDHIFHLWDVLGT